MPNKLMKNPALGSLFGTQVLLFVCHPQGIPSHSSALGILLKRKAESQPSTFRCAKPLANLRPEPLTRHARAAAAFFCGSVEPSPKMNILRIVALVSLDEDPTNSDHWESVFISCKTVEILFSKTPACVAHSSPSWLSQRDELRGLLRTCDCF